MDTFPNRLAEVSQANKSLVCVGLDPDPGLMPIADIAEFNKAIVDSTYDLVCAYKPNIAFYEAQGLKGLEALHKTIEHIRKIAPNVIILGDCKRGDIDTTNAMYAKAMFEVWDFDAVTVHGFTGHDALEPFLEYTDKGIIVLCHTSNEGSKDFQDLTFNNGSQEMPYYEWIAITAKGWNTEGNVGLVVGATYPGQLGVVRNHCPGMPILIPGIGSQGGDLENSVKAGLDKDGPNIMINSSRSILYASKNESDFASAARTAAEKLRGDINHVLEQEGRGW